jgi:hypothetical protein
MEVLDVTTNVVFAVADDSFAEHALELDVFVNFLMSFEGSMIEETLGAGGALDKSLVLCVDCHVHLQ